MAFGIDDIVGAGLRIIDKIIPDPAQRDAAKLQLLQAQQNGELEELKASLSAINSEAQSTDKWTSRARPSFMYVMYIMILAAIPMGIFWAFEPAYADRIATGLQRWLAAIPDDLWYLFGVGYLGYAGGRTLEKWKHGPK